MREPLVLLPPMLCDARVFHGQIAVLSRRRAVTVAPVHLAERIEEVASSLLGVLPPRFALAGAGYGGMVALELVRRAPERVSRLALIASSPLPVSPQEASAREPMIIAARMGRMDDVVAHELPASALAATAHRRDILDLVREMAVALGADAFVAQSRAMQRRRDQTDVLRRMRQPLMIVGGAEDPVYPERRQQFMQDLVPDARLEMVADAGHLPTLEQSRVVTALLEAWLSQPMVLR